MLKAFKLLNLLFLTLILAACASNRAHESTGQFIDSAAITTKVKANLVDKLGAQGLAIQVKTYKDVVQLSGFVHSATVKRHAGLVAANTIDVKHVRNDLIVK